MSDTGLPQLCCGLLRPALLRFRGVVDVKLAKVAACDTPSGLGAGTDDADDDRLSTAMAAPTAAGGHLSGKALKAAADMRDIAHISKSVDIVLEWLGREEPSADTQILLWRFMASALQRHMRDLTRVCGKKWEKKQQANLLTGGRAIFLFLWPLAGISSLDCRIA